MRFGPPVARGVILALVAPLLLLGVAPASAGPAAACRRLCGDLPRSCAATQASCRQQARAAARDARAACATADTPAACRRTAGQRRGEAFGACRAALRRCRAVPLADCRRALREPVVAENDLTACPVSPLAACTELGPDEPCRDVLHPADTFFWDRFRAGDYAAIPEILTHLEAALTERPDDPSFVRHVAWAHIWRLGELSRGLATGDELVASIAATRPRFARAYALNPDDPRVLGFLAGITLAEGIRFGDATLYAQGSALFDAGIAAWPEFNYFSSGYILSQLPRDSAGFQLGLEQQWRNIDVCAGVVIDRRTPDLVATFARETRVGRQRACWNSWIAPFNVEGFFLNLGDVLVKDGQVATALQVYEATRQLADYERWPYRAVLEQRIVDAAENVASFNQEPPVPGRAILFNSPYSCAACHQAR